MNLLFLTASICLFVFSFFHFSNSKRNIFSSLVLFLVGVAYVVYTLFYLVANFFTGKGIDYSVIYHVRFGVHGAGFSEYEALIISTLTALVIGVGGIVLLLWKRPNKSRMSISAIMLSLSAVFLATCIHPASIDLYRLAKGSDTVNFWKHYRHPQVVKKTRKPMNLVLVYAESLERSYFDQTVFPGLINNLRALETDSTTFTNIGLFPNTGWTIAGMVSSQCGIPLVALSHGNSMAGMDSYLAGATCMGDLLAAEGYNLSYIGGASLDFAGKGSFYRTHGFQRVMGKKELTPKLPDPEYITGWGLYDDSLFDLAYDEFNRLSSLGSPFSLVLLTLDTHGSDHFSKSCNEVVERNALNKNIACTDYLIGSFVDRIRKSPASQDTVIVVASDHMAMRGTTRLGKTNRTNLFMILDPQKQDGSEISRKGSTLDLGPTILSSLGFDVQLGLGRDLFNDDATLVEEFTKLGSMVIGWKNDLLSFWSFPRIEDKITINAKDHSVSIDERKFKIPILIQYDEQLKTKIRFQIYNDAIHKTLMQHLSRFNPDDAFLMVDECKRISKQWGDLGEAGLCYVNGTLGTKELDKGKITGTKSVAASALKEIASSQGNHDIYEQRLARLKQ